VTQAPAQAPKPDYGPSLPELLRPRLRALPRWARAGLVLIALALVALAIALVIRSEAATKTYHQSSANAQDRGLPQIPFHFDHSSKLKISRPSGAYVKAERRVNDTLAGSFEVSSFQLGRQPGLVSGFMPIVATEFERREARRHDHFRLVFEGRARVNEVEGYQFAFTARLPQPGGKARQLFGRVVLLPRPYDTSDPDARYPEGQAPKDGLLITMLATTLDKIPSATRVGDEGILQRPFRSFRFGEG
jgi:hypothetical protein